MNEAVKFRHHHLQIDGKNILNNLAMWDGRDPPYIAKLFVWVGTFRFAISNNKNNTNQKIHKVLLTDLLSING